MKQGFDASTVARMMLGILLLLIPCAALSQTGEVKALIIGNNAYKESPMFPPLRGTPSRDAEAVEASLRVAGVAKRNITTLHDLDYAHFVLALHDFRQTLTSQDSAIFYFSGHGFSSDDRAFLVPTDFRLPTRKRLLERRSVTLDQVKNDLSNARMRAFIIDACRTNVPLLKRASRADSDPALANLYDSKPAGTGELVVFATQGGHQAIAEAPAEGLSYFTYYFVNRIRTSSTDLGTIVRDAQIATSTSSKHGQEPEVRDNLQGYLQFPDFVTSSFASKPTQPAQIQAAQPSQPVASSFPFVCPRNGELVGGWQIGNGPTLTDNFGSPVTKKSITVYINFMGSTVQINPLLVQRIAPAAVALDEQKTKELDKVFAEMDALSPSIEEIRGPNGAAMNLHRRYTFFSHNLTSDFDHVRAQSEIFSGKLTIRREDIPAQLNELTTETQNFVKAMDRFAVETANSACEVALKSLIDDAQ